MKSLQKINLVFMILFFVSINSLAQSPAGTVGSWLMLFNQTRLHDKWSIHSEVQFRSFEITPNTEQIMLRGGANYHFNNNYSASGGYAYIPNFDFDKENLNGVQVAEHRLWQQFIMKNNLGRLNFEHRYRLEQRWLQSNIGNGNRYLNRIRYLLRITVPLNKKVVEKHTLFLTFYDELFIHFSSSPFDRNRLYGAIGFQFSSKLNIQVGYLAQTVNLTTKHYLQTAIFYNIDLRKK